MGVLRISDLFLELDRTVFFFFSPLPHMEKLKKVLSLVRLETKKLLVSVDAVVGLEIFATTLADKHTASVLPNCVLVRRWQRLESLVTYIPRVNPLSLVCFVPPNWSHPATTWIPSQSCPQHLQVQIPVQIKCVTFLVPHNNLITFLKKHMILMQDLFCEKYA